MKLIRARDSGNSRGKLFASPSSEFHLGWDTTSRSRIIAFAKTRKILFWHWDKCEISQPWLWADAEIRSKTVVSRSIPQPTMVSGHHPPPHDNASKSPTANFENSLAVRPDTRSREGKIDLQADRDFVLPREAGDPIRGGLPHIGRELSMARPPTN